MAWPQFCAQPALRTDAMRSSILQRFVLKYQRTLKSPCNATCARRSLFISAGSISMRLRWRSAQTYSATVTRSSKRNPPRSVNHTPCTAKLAALVPHSSIQIVRIISSTNSPNPFQRSNHCVTAINCCSETACLNTTPIAQHGFFA